MKTLKMLEEVATRIKIYAEDAGIPVIEVASAAWQRKLYPAKRKPGMTNAQWKRTKYLFFERIFRNLCAPHLRQAWAKKRIKEDIIAARCIGWEVGRAREL